MQQFYSALGQAAAALLLVLPVILGAVRKDIHSYLKGRRG